LQSRGTIYHHIKLVFHNGFIGKKYLILINTPSKNEPYLFLKITSQKKDKPTTSGCIKKHSLFFIPAPSLPIMIRHLPYDKYVNKKILDKI
jgi:hypothetical protein